MKCLRTGLAIALLFACLGALPAHAAAVDPAEIVPADSLFYVEISEDGAQQALASLAMPPVSGLMLPEQRSTPFGHLTSLLDLPEGAADSAAPHLRRVAAGFEGNFPFVLLSFDDPEAPAALLEGRVRNDMGVAVGVVGPASAAVRDGVLVLGSQTACTRIAVGDYAPLAPDPGFVQAREKMDDAPAWAYVSVPGLIARIRQEMRPQEAQVLGPLLTATGLVHARYAAAKVTGVPEPDALQIMLEFGNAEARLLQLASDQPIAAAGEVPADPAAVVLLHWQDGSAFLGGIRDMLLEIDDQVGRGAMRREIGQIREAFGFTLDELFGSIGAGAAAWLPGPEPGTLIGRQEWAAVVLLENPATFERCLDALLAAMVRMPAGPHPVVGPAIKQLGPAPAWYTVTEDRLVVGGSPETVRRYLDWLEDPTRLGMGGAEAPTGSVRIVADTGMLLAGYPAPEPGAKAVVSLAREGNGLLLRAGAEDFDPAQAQKLAIRAYPALMVAVLAPALARARTQARVTAGMANLRNIGLGLTLYAQDNGGAYPETLAQLLDLGYLATPSVLVDPTDPAPPLIPGTQTPCSYRYVGPAMQYAPPNVIVCYTRPGLDPEGRYVLHRDATVMRATDSQLTGDWNPDSRTSLRESYEAFLFQATGELTVRQQTELREFYGIEE
jgi:hypothetical protein